MSDRPRKAETVTLREIAWFERDPRSDRQAQRPSERERDNPRVLETRVTESIDPHREREVGLVGSEGGRQGHRGIRDKVKGWRD